MRDYGRVYTSFWNHPKVRALSDDGRTAALYLLTSPHSNSIGAYLLPDAYVVDDLGWNFERVAGALSELFAKGFAQRFADGRHIAICDFVEWNTAENPNVVKSMIKHLDQLPNDPAKAYAVNGILSHDPKWIPGGDRNRLETLSKALKPKGFETLSQPFRKPEPEPNLTRTGVGGDSSSNPESDNLLFQNQVSAREKPVGATPSESVFLLDGKNASDSAEEPVIRHHLLESLDRLKARGGVPESKSRPGNGAARESDSVDLVTLEPSSLPAT